MQEQTSTPSWLDRPLFGNQFRFTLETLLVVIILLVTLTSRFAMLGERVMSHDEVNHVWPSHDLYMGRGYAHSPVTHGPFQFHIVALSYFLLGDSDFSARVPAALFSTAAVAFVLFGFRRYLGRVGALLAGLFFAISPYMLFYGRYTRNEGFIELLGVLMLYAVLRHLEKGDQLSLFLLTTSLVMHFVVKETSFIYSAQLLLFIGLLFVAELARLKFKNANGFNIFLILVIMAALLAGAAVAAHSIGGAAEAAVVTPLPTEGPEAPAQAAPLGPSSIVMVVLAAAALASLVGALVFVIRDLGWARVRSLRSANLLLLTGTLVLPQLTAFPVAILGWDPLDYSSTTGLLHNGGLLIVMLIISAVIGLLWNWRFWLSQAAIFYGVFVFFYTTMFTNANGFFTGIIGSLGYWLSQQEVNRGSQPIYYYALLQVPFYEFLAAAGTLLAVYFGIRHHSFSTLPGVSPADSRAARPEQSSSASSDEPADFYANPRPLPVLCLLLYWSVTALVAYSVAGEKMPWLTVHIALPLLLAAGWGLGFLVDTTHWARLVNRKGIIALLLFPVFLTSLTAWLGSLLGPNPPFSGSSLDQLTATNTFIFALIGVIASAGGIIYLLKEWSASQLIRLATITVFAFLTVLTARASYRASFVNYDYATEFLVYAHAGPGPKEVLRQVEEIAARTVGDKQLVVAYSDDAIYPYKWYFRDYPNQRWFGKNPSRDLNTVPVIIAGEDVMNKMEPIVGNDYVKFEYIRLWWPMQDYYPTEGNKIFSKTDMGNIRNALTNPEMRAALWDIWLNRDYSEYARLTGKTTLTLSTWQPSAKMDVYIRKDVIGQIWNYGAAPAIIEEPIGDPYAEQILDLYADQVIGQSGAEPGMLMAPRGMALAADGSLYVADSRNHRIQQFAADGTFIRQWGTFDDIADGNAPGGTFNEPWDVAVGLDGSVYVTDTWNHRIQQFTADGQFIRTWGYFGQAETGDAFWGPRALAVDGQGRIYVTDTGNKRVVVFNPDGTYVTEFGSAGFDIGQFDEPVGLAIDAVGQVYVADTWNQRVQVFFPDESGTVFSALRQIEISGWYGQSLDNKPFLKISPETGNLFVTDPEGPRVLEFNTEGQFVRGWGQFSIDLNGFGIASALAIDPQGGVWVSDASNNRLMRFTLP